MTRAPSPLPPSPLPPSPPLPSSPPPSSSAEEALAEAQAAFSRELWSEAARLAFRALRSAPSPQQMCGAYLVLARARWHLGAVPSCCRSAASSRRYALLTGDGLQLINATTLVAFSLAEIGLPEQARRFALQALDMARTPAYHPRLPLALSCAAHVHACLGDLDRAEEIHMHALSHARESSDHSTLLLAYGNLLQSFVLLARASVDRRDADALRAVMLRLDLYITRIWSSFHAPGVEEWRNVNLTVSLGELKSLSTEHDEDAEALLLDGLHRALQLGSTHEVLTARSALAEMRLRQGRPEEALQHLHDIGLGKAIGAGSHGREMRNLAVARASCLALDRAEEARAWEERLQFAEQIQSRARQETLRFISSRADFSAS